MRRIRTAIVGAAALCAVAILPAAAAADCSLSNASSSFLNGSPQLIQGNFKPELNGKFIQIPFDVPAGTTGMRIRYCYDGSGTTLDMGVYEPRPGGQENWGMDQRRGWSGSAVRTIGIGVNGYTDEATYDSARKAYVAGKTTRAFKAGPMPAGTWAVELGAGWIDPALTDGTNWKVEVTTSSAPEWADAPFTADPYQPYVANSASGWYTGDFHAHGEMEPGNAPMKKTFDLGFGALPGGSGLDFMTIVDHNNDNARGVLGAYEDQYPGKLLIPGIEVTTYDGHTNSQNSDAFVDFRMSSIYRMNDDGDGLLEDGELSLVRGPENPSSRFAEILENGGWSQINHPTIFKTAPSVCRGCAWNYDDAQTDFSTVAAIEIQTGPAGLPAGNPTGMNPFTRSAIEYYEHALSTGAHVAAVGSSDDHQGGGATGVTDSPVGRGATVVHADQLSQSGVTAAVRAGHTYVKPFGADAPDVELSATTPEGGSAIPGDSISGASLDVSIAVKGAASAVRPGPYTLSLLQDGIEIDSIQVSGDSFSHTFTVTESGRYSFRLTRPLGATDTGIEAYSTPVWFTHQPPVVVKPSNAFSFGAFKANRKKGTAVLRVKVASPGTLRLVGAGLKKASAKVAAKNRTVTLNLKPKAALKKKLKKRGSAKVKIKVTNSPVGGQALSKSRTVKLLGKKAKKRKRR